MIVVRVDLVPTEDAYQITMYDTETEYAINDIAAGFIVRMGGLLRGTRLMRLAMAAKLKEVRNG